MRERLALPYKVPDPNTQQLRFATGNVSGGRRRGSGKVQKGSPELTRNGAELVSLSGKLRRVLDVIIQTWLLKFLGFAPATTPTA